MCDLRRADSRLDEVPPVIQKRVLGMVESDALPVDRVVAQVAELTRFGTRARLCPPVRLVTDAEARAIVLADEYQAKRSDRDFTLGEWLGLTEDEAALTMAASVPDEKVAGTRNRVARAQEWLAEIAAVLTRRALT
jgi:hypothetical protein